MFDLTTHIGPGMLFAAVVFLAWVVLAVKVLFCLILDRPVPLEIHLYFWFLLSIVVLICMISHAPANDFQRT